jgi:hypothetical protein
MRRSGLEGLRSKKFDGFLDVRAVATLLEDDCLVVQACAGNERL